MGLAIQTASFDFAGVTVSDSNVGLAGLNLGIGGFLSPDVGVLFRISGSNVESGNVRIVSGFAGPAVQYFVTDLVRLEGGVGFGFADFDTFSESGWALLLGTNVAIWQNHGHRLHLGVEYAPAFLGDATVHNSGFTFGWQLL